jgi:GxxExxY protein
MEYSNIPDEVNKLSNEIIGLAIKVHRALGPGLLESSYLECLCYELAMAGYLVEKEKVLPLVYEAVKLDIGYRIDILADNKIIIEVKAVESISDVHIAQILTYLKLSHSRIGLLINFNLKLLKDGIKRLVL